MEGLYRGIETSLLALGLALGLAVASLSSLPSRSTAVAVIATTLPMISVTAGDEAD